MKFIETPVSGAFIVEIEPRIDSRGFFARMFCVDEFRDHGLDPRIIQINNGLSHRAGTLRGLHFQREPHADTKLVRCVRGAVFDVCVDLRPLSPTFLRHAGAELDADNRRMLFVPAGCAHGYQALADDTEIMYTTNVAYAPSHATGVRFDDPSFAIDWPLSVSEISEADRNWPDYAAETG